jgi:hypothetical protein
MEHPVATDAGEVIIIVTDRAYLIVLIVYRPAVVPYFSTIRASERVVVLTVIAPLLLISPTQSYGREVV